MEREILPVFDVSLSVDRADLFIASFAFFIVFDLSDAQISSTLGLPILSSKRRRREGDSSRRLETPPRRKFEEDDKKRGREYRSFPPLSPLLYTPSLLRSRLRSNLEPLSVTYLSLCFLNKDLMLLFFQNLLSKMSICMGSSLLNSTLDVN